MCTQLRFLGKTLSTGIFRDVVEKIRSEYNMTHERCFFLGVLERVLDSEHMGEANILVPRHNFHSVKPFWGRKNAQTFVNLYRCPVTSVNKLSPKFDFLKICNCRIIQFFESFLVTERKCFNGFFCPWVHNKCKFTTLNSLYTLNDLICLN